MASPGNQHCANYTGVLYPSEVRSKQLSKALELTYYLNIQSNRPTYC